MAGDISVDPEAVAQTVKRLLESFDKAKATADNLPGQDAGGSDDPLVADLNASIRALLATLGFLADGLRDVVASTAEDVKLTLADFDALDSSLMDQLAGLTAEAEQVPQDTAIPASDGRPLPKAAKAQGSPGW
jgi:hypothetical protein